MNDWVCIVVYLQDMKNVCEIRESAVIPTTTLSIARRFTYSS